VKRVLSIFISAVMMLGLLIPVSASAQKQASKGVYIVDEDTEPKNNNFATYKVVQTDFLPNTDLSAYNNIIVQAECLTSSVEESIVEAYNSSSRIVFLGDISINTVRDFLGLDQNEMTNSTDQRYPQEHENEVEQEGMENVSNYPSIGKMIYQDNRGVNITDIRVKEPENETLVKNAVLRCLEYDYLYLSTGVTEDNAILRSGDFSNSWRNVDVMTKSYTLGDDYGTVNVSLKVDKNTGNPNSSGEYLYYVPYIIDIEMRAGYYIENATAEVGGSDTSKIYDYGPTNTSCSANASISFGLPYSVSVTFSPGSKVAITKESGGIDSKTVKIKYQPKDALGVNAVASNLRCDAHAETYDTNSTAFGTGQFRIQVGEYRQTITTYYSKWDTVSGT